MKRLAQTILKAQELREESFNHKAADKAVKEKRGFIDFIEFYTLSLEEAADKACELSGYDTRATQIVYLIIKHLWNDSQDWAKSYI